MDARSNVSMISFIDLQPPPPLPPPHNTNNLHTSYLDKTLLGVCGILKFFGRGK